LAHGPRPGEDVDFSLVVFVGRFAVDAVELDVGICAHDENSLGV
jgi:hypothetical protein